MKTSRPRVVESRISMVRRGSTVRVRQRALLTRRTARKWEVSVAIVDTVEHLPNKEGVGRIPLTLAAPEPLEQAATGPRQAARGMGAPRGQVSGHSFSPGIRCALLLLTRRAHSGALSWLGCAMR